MKWVKWLYLADNGETQFGQMPLQEVQKELAKFEKEARRLLEKENADHVVYGMKLYDENGEIDKVKFYLHPMGEEEFQKDVASLKNCVIYAVHARK